LDRGERLLETRAIIARSTSLVGTQLPRIDTRLEQRIALQVCGLPLSVTGDSQITNE